MKCVPPPETTTPVGLRFHHPISMRTPASVVRWINNKWVHFIEKHMKVVICEKTWGGGGSRNESYASNCSDVVGRRAARQSKVETDTFPIKKVRNKNIHFSSKYRSRKSATIDFPLWVTIENSPKFPGNPPKIDGSPTSKSDFSELRRYFYLGPFSMS